MIEYPVSLSLALPVRNHLILIFLYLAVRDGIMLYLAATEHLEILHRVAVQLRECGDGLWLGTSLPDYKLVIAYVNPLFRTEVVKILGTHDGNRVLSVILFVKFGFYQCPFNRKRRLGIDRLLAQHVYSFCHNMYFLLSDGYDISVTAAALPAACRYR